MNDTIKSALENLPICAYMTDLNNNLVAGSAEFVKVINRERYELQELTLADIYDADHLELIKEEIEVVQKTGNVLETERQVIFPSKSFWGRIKHVPVFDDESNLKYIIAMYENIDSEKELERQKEYFIETLTHDLKVPTLAQLRGIELLKSEIAGTLTNEQKELTSQIEQSCKYILDMISMIVNTYRFESGENKLVYSEFSLSKLLLECFETLTPSAKEKNIMFVYRASSNEVIIEADRVELKKVIINLLSNALIYSNKNETVYIDIDINNNKVEFIITSRGIPLSEKDCMTLFDQFGAKTPIYNTIGNGIALYLCKKIIDVHNGKIFATSDGTSINRYTFIIPQYVSDVRSLKKRLIAV